MDIANSQLELNVLNPIESNTVGLEYPNSILPGELKVGKDGKLLKKIINVSGIAGDLINQYNHWITERLTQQIANNTILLKDGRLIAFVVDQNDKIEIQPPIYKNKLMTPLMAADFSQTYSVTIVATPKLFMPKYDDSGNVVYKSDGTIEYIGMTVGKKVDMLKIPLMVKSQSCTLDPSNKWQSLLSGTCPNDPGGYFIIKGTDRVLPGQQKLEVNKPIIYVDNSTGTDVLTFTSYNINGSTKLTLANKTAKNKLLDKIDFFGVNLPIFGKDSKSHEIFINSLFIYRIFIPNITNDNIKAYIFQFINPKHYSKIMRVFQETLFLNDISPDPYDDLLKVFFNTETDKLSKGLQNNHHLKKFFAKNRLNISGKLSDELKYTVIQYLINEYFFTHLEGENNNIGSKITLYSYCIAQYLEQLIGVRTPDDRDSWFSKSIMSAAGSLEQLIGQFWRKHINDTTDKINKKIGKSNLQDVNKLLQFGDWRSTVSTMNSNIEGCFNSNAWGTPKAPKKNIAQALARDNIPATIMHLQSVISPVNKSTKQDSVRNVQVSQSMFFDVNNTPESDMIGLKIHRTLFCRFSQMQDHNILIALIKPYSIPTKSDDNPNYNTFLMVNGIPVGFVTGQAMNDYLIQLRRASKIPEDIGIIYDRKSNVIYILTVWGRPIVPFLIINKESHRLIIDEKNLWDADFDEQFKAGAIEYLCPWEAWLPQNKIAQSIDDIQAELDYYNAIYNQIEMLSDRITELEVLDDTDFTNEIENLKTNKNLLQYRYNQKREFYTHSVIHPLGVSDYTSSLIPLFNFNQGPRITYGINQIRQAMGLQSSIIMRRDTTIRTMGMATRPLVSTLTYDVLGLDLLPQGMTVNYAIMTLGGYNIEDAIIVNRDFIDRGGFMNTIYKTISVKLNKINSNKDASLTEIFDYPLNDNKYPGLRLRKPADKYVNLDKNGMVIEGSMIKPGDCLVGKILIKRDKNNGQLSYVDISYFAKVNEEGIVEEAIDNTEEIFIRLRNTVPPQKGDKFSNRHAQKSVIGTILPGYDMPFAADGWTPDIILSPFAVPSRMTIGMLYEMIMGNYAILAGERVNATAFEAFDLDKFENLMGFYGFKRNGTKQLYSGKLGIPIEVRVFSGPMYYQALRHRVDEKIQGQAIGPINAANRQAIAGRKKDGGLRFGEMERDALVEHGARHLLQDRMLISSDLTKQAVCIECGEFAIRTEDSNEYNCPICKSSNIGSVEMPASFAMFCNMVSGQNLRISPNLQIRKV